MSLLDDFRTEVETYLTKAKVDPSTFGRDALKDPGFIFDLREGRSPHLRTIERVRDFIAEHPPVDTPSQSPSERSEAAA